MLGQKILPRIWRRANKAVVLATQLLFVGTAAGVLIVAALSAYVFVTMLTVEQIEPSKVIIAQPR